jgi:hypothetical protein
MTTSQDDIQTLQRAIRQLSQRDREELAEWILNSLDTESWVAEAAVRPPGGRKSAGSGRETDDPLLLAWRGYSAVIAALEQTSEHEAFRASSR